MNNKLLFGSTRFAKSLVVAATLAALTPGLALAASNGGPAAGAPDATGLLPNQAQGLCTAAINSDGSIAGGFHVNPTKTLHLGTGQYQVSFTFPCNPPLAKNGWMRFVQVDTLRAGSLPSTTCETADRLGEPSALYINCESNGAPVDTSFMLMVTK